MGRIVLSSHHQQMQVITNKEERGCFYFTTRGRPVGTFFFFSKINQQTYAHVNTLQSLEERVANKASATLRTMQSFCISLREHASCQESQDTFSQSLRIRLDHKEISENCIGKIAQILFQKKKKAIESLSQIGIQYLFWHRY